MTARPDPERSQTLVGLLERYSPTGLEGEAAAWLVERMAYLGYGRAWIDEAGSAVGVMGEGPRQVVLLGHIDTVPGRIPVRLEGEAVFGRGAVDAKGPLACFVDTVARVGPQPGWQWVVIGAVDEEGDSRGARRVAETYRPEFVIVGEPSRWDRITLGYKGSAWTTVTVRRPRAHPASPGENACQAALALWRDVEERAESFNRGRPRPFEQLSPTLHGWSSGEDETESWASLRLGARLPADLSPEAWFGDLNKIGSRAEIQPYGFAVGAYRGDKNSRLARAFVRAIRAAGGDPAFVLKTGTADLNIVAPRWSCPGLAYGPGDSRLDHTAQEHISLTEFDLAGRVLADVLPQLASVPKLEAGFGHRSHR